MDTPTAVEVNCETGETIVRPLTAEEITAQQEAAIAAETERVKAEAEAQAIADAKSAAIAKLAALGLTPEEIAALSK